MLSRLWKAYDSAVVRSPMTVNIISATIITSVGEWSATTIDFHLTGEVRQGHYLAVAFYGGLCMAPSGVLWYKGLDKWTRHLLRVPKGVTMPLILTKVFADAAIFGAAHICLFWTYKGLVVDKLSLKDSWSKVERDFVPYWVVDSIGWTFFQIFNFTKIPVRHQMLMVNCASILDAVALCWSSHHNLHEIVANMFPSSKN